MENFTLATKCKFDFVGWFYIEPDLFNNWHNYDYQIRSHEI